MKTPSNSTIPFLLLLCFLFFSTCIFAQIKLDRNISFEELMKTKTERTVSWTNPNEHKETLTFLEMAIPIGKEMKQLTRKFNQNNYGIGSYWLNPKMIVLHSMDLGNLQQSLEQSSLLNDLIPESWGTLSKAGKLPNGAHFMIDQDGTIYCLAPPVSPDQEKVDYNSADHKWYIKRHQDGNPCAIGIENLTPANGDFTDLTSKQQEANAKLIRWLASFENKKIVYLTSHHQFNEEKALDLFHDHLQLNYQYKSYRTQGRTDIGDQKLNDIRKLVNSFGYHLKSDPDQ